MVTKKDSKYANAQSIQDFAGAKLTSQLGTIHYNLIDQIAGADKQPAMDDYSTMITSLASGKIDGFTSEYPAAKSAALSNPNLQVVQFPAGSGFEFSDGEASVAIGIKKDNSELKTKVDQALTAISKTERDSLMDQALETQPLSE
jgi:ABC-type amino acid transport substrate-binding protein